jgi:hypothetical protein
MLAAAGESEHKRPSEGGLLVEMTISRGISGGALYGDDLMLHSVTV